MAEFDVATDMLTRGCTSGKQKLLIGSIEKCCREAKRMIPEKALPFTIPPKVKATSIVGTGQKVTNGYP